MSEPPARVVALVGATASGKSSLAHRVAVSLKGDVEILSVDAMAVYRGMDIGTAKPTLPERQEIPYHLIDLVDPSEDYGVALYQRDARASCQDVTSRGRAALFVGGTGLYVRAVVDDLDLPGQYPAVRQELEDIARTDLPVLYAELQRNDPEAASRMEPTNTRRVVRALEVCRGSGRKFSSYGPGLGRYPNSAITQIGLRVDHDELATRVERRFHQWMAQGLLDEVRSLRERPAGLSQTSRQAVGYKELLAHLDEGRDLDSCVRDAINASKRLARRQRSWFQRDPRIEWYDDVEQAFGRLVTLLATSKVVVRD